MPQLNRIEFALQCFAKNRRIVQQNLAGERVFIRELLDFRHGRASAGPVRDLLLWMMYPYAKWRIIPAVRDARYKIRFYRQVEADLERGDLGSAIEALSLFAPREETTAETIRRVRTNPVAVWAIQRSPHILRENMLRLRDDLASLQREKKAC